MFRFKFALIFTVLICANSVAFAAPQAARGPSDVVRDFYKAMVTTAARPIQ